MKKTDIDILKENTQLKEMPFRTPEGYFENLRESLTNSRGMTQSKQYSSKWIAISAAAAIAILITAGTLFLPPSSTDNGFTEEDYFVFSDDFSTDIIYSTSTLYAYSETLSEEEIIQYLIDTDYGIDDIE